MANLEIIITAKNKAKDVFSKMKGALSSIATLAGGAVAAAATAAGAALVGLGASGLKTASALESQMSGIAATMGKTKSEIAPLNDLILNLGVDPGLKVSALEAAGAIEMLAKNGLSMTDIIDGAARSTVALSNATGGDFSNSADIMTDVLALWQGQFRNAEGGVTNLEAAINGLTAVTVNSKIDIDGMGLALANAGGVASGAGVEFADFTAVIAGTSSAFSGGAEAGTGFKTFLQRLAAPTDVAIKKMQELGLVTADGSNLFYDAEGNLKSMADVAGLLSGALGNLTEQERASAMATLFGDASSTAIELAKLGADGFAELQAKMADVSAADAAAERVDNLSGTMEILSSVVEGFKIKIGNALLPSMKVLAQTAVDFASKHGDKLVKVFEVIGGLAESYLPTALTALGGLLSNLGKYFSAVAEDGDTLNDWLSHLPGFLKLPVQFLGELMAVVRNLFNTFSGGDLKESLSVPPFVTESLQNLGNATENLGFFWEQYGPKITQIVTDTLGHLGSNALELAGEILPFFTEMLEDVSEWFIGNGPAIESAVGNISTAIKFLSDEGVKMWEVIEPTWTLLKDLMLGVATIAVNVLAGDFDAALTSMEQTATKLWSNIKTVFDTALNFIVGHAGKSTGELWNDWQGTLKLIEIATPMLREVWQDVFGQMEEIARLIWQNIQDAITEKITEILLSITEYTTQIRDDIQAKFDEAKTNALLTITNLYTGLADTFTTMRITAENTVSTLSSNVQNTFSGMKKEVLGKIEQVVSGIKSTFSGENWSQVAQNVVNAIVGGFQGGVETMKSAANTVIDAFKSVFLPSENNPWLALGTDIITGLIDGIQANMGAFKDNLYDMVKKIIGQLNPFGGGGPSGAFSTNNSLASNLANDFQSSSFSNFANDFQLPSLRAIHSGSPTPYTPSPFDQGGNTIENHYHYHLTVRSEQPSTDIVSDFELMHTLAS